MIIAIFAAASVCISVPLDTPPEFNPGAPTRMVACNVHPPGWNWMSQAPKDGTVIEIRNGFGLLPTYSIARWASIGRNEFAWVDATPIPPCKDPPGEKIKDKDGQVIGMSFSTGCQGTTFYDAAAGAGLAWRPYTGKVEDYHAHNPTMDDWRRAMHLPVRRR